MKFVIIRRRLLMFTKAITKKPCRALTAGITTAMFGEGVPDYDEAVRQHDRYVKTLESLGLEVLDLEADERYPDSCFVEDPAVVMEKCAIITNPAKESRNGEKFEIIDAVKRFYREEQIFFLFDKIIADLGTVACHVIII